MNSDYNNVAVAISNYILRQLPYNKVNQKETKRGKIVDKKTPYATDNDPGVESSNISNNRLDAACNELQGKESELSALYIMEEMVESKLQLLNIAESISQAGSWKLDLRTNKMIWSDELFKVFGVNPTEFVPTLEAIVSFIHTEDRDSVSNFYKHAIENGGDYHFQKRIVLPDGSIRTIHSQGRTEKDANGVVNGLVGIFKDITLEKQHQENQQQSESYFKGAFDHSAIGMAIVGVDGSWKEVNDSTCKLLGYSRQEFMKLTFQDITFSDDLKLDLDYFNELLAGKRESYQMEKRYFHKNGSIIWALLVVSAVKDTQGKVLHFISQIKDITDRKNRELDLVKREQQYRSLFDQNTAAVFSVDIKGNITSANKVFAVKTESSIDQIETMHYRQFVHPDDLQKTNEAFEDVKNGKAGEIKIRVFTFLGNELHIILILLPVMVNNLITSIYAIAHDITVDEKAQQELEKAINDLSKIMAASVDVICTIDEAGRFVQVSAAAETMFGYTPDELIGSLQIDLVYKLDIASTNKAFAEVKSGISKTNFENRCISKTGHQVPIEWSARYDKTDQLIYCIARDATEMKAAELEKEFERKNKEALINSTDDLIWSIDKNFNLITANNAYLKIVELQTGLHLNAGDSVLFIKGIDPATRLYWESLYKRALSGEIFSIEIFTPASGVTMETWRETNFNTIVDDENIIGAAVYSRDTTDRKKTEVALHLSNERYTFVTKATFDAIWDLDLIKNSIYWGEGYKNLFGYNITDAATESDVWLKLIHPEDLQRVQYGIESLVAGKETNWSDEYRYLKANGEYAFVADKGIIVRDEQGMGIRMIGAMRDITREKREEQQLKLFESLITKTNEGVLIIEGETSDKREAKILYVNEAFSQMTGYSKEEITGNTLKMLEGPKSDQKAFLQLQQAIQKGESCDIETIQYRKNGEGCWVSLSIVPIADENGWFRHWIAIARDISQRKSQEAEKEVFFNFVQSLGKLELGQAWMNILESICTYAGFDYAEAWMVNFDQSNVLLNQSWANNNRIQQLLPSEKIRKIKKGEGLTGKAWLTDSVVYVNDITSHSGFLSKEFALEAGLNSAVYIPVLFNGNAIALINLYSSEVEINNSNFKTLFENISQQLGPYVQSKKMEDELARFFNLSPDFMAIAGVDGFFKKINPAVSKILGYSQEELFARPISDFIHPEDRELTNTKRRSLEEGNPLLNFENRYLTKNGETRWLSWTSTPLHEEGIIFAVAKDTTEKKKLDEERKRILESISDFFFALDKDFRFTYMNSATEKLFQLNPGALIGKNIWHEWPRFKEGIFYENVQQSIGSKTPVSFEFFDESSNSWFEESFYPSEDGLSVFFRSINDRKAAEKALKEAFKEKDTILESIGDAFFALDKNRIVTYWNKMAEQLLKINREDIIGKNLWDVFPDTLPDSILTNYQKAIDINGPIHFEEYYRPFQTWLEISAYPSQGGLSVYFKDISVRKKAEESIRTSNERYDMVARATNDAIWDWDLITNKVIRPGKRLETLFGYDGREAEEVDDFWNQYAHPGDWAEVIKKRNKLFENPDETFWEDEYRFLRTTGDYGYVYDKGYIIRNQEGKAIRMIGASKDITREKEQVNEIIRIQQNLDSLINTTTDLIWSINADFKIIAVNKAYSKAIEAITGNAANEGDSVFLPLIDNAVNDRWLSYYTRVLAGETFYIEESFSSPSVSSEWHNIVSFSPIVNKNGLISGVACFAKDITELKKAGQKLVELNYSLEKRAEELATSNSELERFAYVASHDLQEPLRMVSSFLQLLQRKYNDQLDDTAHRYIHFSVDGAERMKRLINDLLQYSRAGTASLDIVPVDMNEVMADVLMLFKNEVHTIDAEITVENLPVIYAGKSSMSQLIQNLVGNAIKYRSKEKPVIKISAKEQGDEWVFTIADNGIGIDSKFNEKIFIIFQRLHNKDEFNGTGIGLAICKKIIERYKGKIWVESEFGKGSKFIFAIPKKKG